MNRRGFLGTLAAITGAFSLKAKDAKQPQYNFHERLDGIEDAAFNKGDAPRYLRIDKNDFFFEEHYYSNGLAQIKVERLGERHAQEPLFRLAEWRFDIEPQNFHVVKVWRREE